MALRTGSKKKRMYETNGISFLLLSPYVGQEQETLIRAHKVIENRKEIEEVWIMIWLCKSGPLPGPSGPRSWTGGCRRWASGLWTGQSWPRSPNRQFKLLLKASSKKERKETTKRKTNAHIFFQKSFFYLSSSLFLLNY